VLVYYAASLAKVMSGVKTEFERINPDLELRMEPSGSQVAARKVAELNRPCDLLIAADYEVIDSILIPEHAEFNVLFASNEIVLAYTEHSRFTDEVTADNWPEILSRPEVRLGRVNDALAPLGYQTRLVWKLAESHYGGPARDLETRLLAKIEPRQVMVDAAELVGLLESKAIDYAFLFANQAQEHSLKSVRLPPEINLGQLDQSADYAKVEIPVQMKSGAPPVMRRGGPVLLGMTIPKRAPNPSGAEKLAVFLLGRAGQEIFNRSGIRLLEKPMAKAVDRLPPALKSLAAPLPADGLH
jgi:molybdate/tungstate transport system substrate-binding protein